jgi:acyl transferase domain-containing protein
VFSANHPDSLQKVIQNVENYYSRNRPSLNDLAYTLGARREHLAHRAFSITDGSLPLEVSPAAKCGLSQRPVFVFTGQGAQWPGMGKELMEDFPSFLQDIRSMDETLAKLEHPPSWTIESMYGKWTFQLLSLRSRGLGLTI